MTLTSATTTTLPENIRDSIQSALTQVNWPLNCTLNFWEEDRLRVVTGSPETPALTLNIQHPGVIRALYMQRDPLVLADAYLDGFVDFVGPIEELIHLFRQLPQVKIGVGKWLPAWLEALTLPALPDLTQPRSHPDSVAHTPARDRAAIRHHYDVGNAFYRLWLDSRLVYSCAYFASPDMDIDTAQAAKLDRICQKLRLQPGETLLDVGCGWGALLRWAAEHYGVRGYGITLSEEQQAFAQQQIEAAGLADRIQVDLRDYRDLPSDPTFDKAVSIGMVEHVGLKNYPTYFNRVRAALKPGGLFLNHGITSSQAWNGQSIGERFIQRYIFPDGELVRLSEMTAAMEDAGWEVIDVDGWRPHYAKTLRHWADRLTQAWEQAVALVGPRRVQLWRLYLLGSALAFEHNDMGIYQVLLQPQRDRAWNLPLTREGWLC